MNGILNKLKMKKDHKIKIKTRLNKYLLNYFGEENYDNLRFGEYLFKGENNQISIFLIFYNKFLNFFGLYNKNQKKIYNNKVEEIFTNYNLNFLDSINEIDLNLAYDLICYRLMGFRHVKLRTNTMYYWYTINKINSIENQNKFIKINFEHFKRVNYYDLNPFGKDVKLYFNKVGIAVDFLLEQYRYNIKPIDIKVNQGDVVFDLGACWGDTALYFSDLAGLNGKVYSFEFIPSNIQLFNTNMDLNPRLSPNIELVSHPVHDTSGVNMFYKDNGPGSFVSFNEIENYDGIIKTISLDDFVSHKGIEKVDFIKMDIEGAEQAALKGALNTIKRFKPKLAVAIYHSDDDFYQIPQLLTDLGYRIFINHYTIHQEETICFAIPI